jgi:hypothetical protein
MAAVPQGGGGAISAIIGILVQARSLSLNAANHMKTHSVVFPFMADLKTDEKYTIETLEADMVFSGSPVPVLPVIKAMGNMQAWIDDTLWRIRHHQMFMALCLNTVLNEKDPLYIQSITAGMQAARAEDEAAAGGGGELPFNVSADTIAVAIGVATGTHPPPVIPARTLPVPTVIHMDD